MVIATVFLTIAGMAGGYVLSERHRPGGGDQSNQSPQERQTTTVVGDSSTAPFSSGPSTGPPCPAEASEKAVEFGRPSRLSQVMKIVTDNGSTVWICQDPSGALYYQSKTGGVNSALVQGKNGLFLINVHRDGDQYEAVAPQTGNRIVVSRKSLQVRFTNGNTQTNDVISVEG